MHWTVAGALGTNGRRVRLRPESGMLLFLTVVHTLAFLAIAGWLGPGRCGDIACLWVLLLFSLPAFAIYLSIWTAARFCSSATAVITAFVANLAVASGGAAWFVAMGGGEGSLAQDIMYAVWYLLIGMVAGLLLIGYVRVVQHVRTRGMY